MTLDFSYNVERQTLAIQTRDPFNPTVIQKDFLLSCLPLTDFTDYHTKLPPDPGPDLLGEVHAGLLRM
jgi:hypothetical protein